MQTQIGVTPTLGQVPSGYSMNDDMFLKTQMGLENLWQTEAAQQQQMRNWDRMNPVADAEAAAMVPKYQLDQMESESAIDRQPLAATVAKQNLQATGDFNQLRNLRANLIQKSAGAFKDPEVTDVDLSHILATNLARIAESEGYSYNMRLKNPSQAAKWEYLFEQARLNPRGMEGAIDRMMSTLSADQKSTAEMDKQRLSGHQQQTNTQLQGDLAYRAALAGRGGQGQDNMYKEVTDRWDKANKGYIADLKSEAAARGISILVDDAGNMTGASSPQGDAYVQRVFPQIKAEVGAKWEPTMKQLEVERRVSSMNAGFPVDNVAKTNTPQAPKQAPIFKSVQEVMDEAVKRGQPISLETAQRYFNSQQNKK